MKKLLIALLAFTLTLCTLVFTIYAYFSDQSSTNATTFTLGEVSFSYEGNLKTDYIVPGENIIETPIVLTNLSSIDTELRMSITVSSSVYTNDTTLETLFGYDQFSNPYFSLGDGFVLEGNYYYYRGPESLESPNGVFRIQPNSNPITVLSYIELDGYKFTNNHANGTISITITFQAKQADFVTWTTLGQINYDFSIGN